jgi:hypothetical protein
MDNSEKIQFLHANKYFTLIKQNGANHGLTFDKDSFKEERPNWQLPVYFFTNNGTGRPYISPYRQRVFDMKPQIRLVLRNGVFYDSSGREVEVQSETAGELKGREDRLDMFSALPDRDDLIGLHQFEDLPERDEIDELKPKKRFFGFLGGKSRRKRKCRKSMKSRRRKIKRRY